MKHDNSNALFKRAEEYIPGGVNSPVRAFKSVGTAPVFAASAHGSHIVDEDGNSYLDYICSWGPLIFGHSPNYLLEGLTEAVSRGITYGLPTAAECEIAEIICHAYPGLDMVRMVNSGTEATMSAIRVARGYTGRNKIVKFEGCYHGHSDALLVSSGSGTLTYGVPTSPGVPAQVVADTLVCRYNDHENIREVFSACGDEIACIIVEPVAGNMGLVPGRPEFLRTLRELADAYGSVLIFDEVISGFRAAYGGAAELYGIRSDIACFGKIIGSGLPVGAYGGRRDIMACVSPSGPVYQAGTLSGNPLAMFLGIKSLRLLQNHPEIYAELENKGKKLQQGMEENIRELNLPYRVVRCGSLLTLFFCEGEVNCYDDVKRCDTALYGRYFRGMLEQGILLPPSQYECMFLSQAHSDEDIAETVEKQRIVLKELI
ncbi:MAG: glutamate-1-semialdehyde-2,1-aminomutase [Firmicutes bacterium HGW-Firmicutes-16]|nr:MAG: glutamate-1-semialdehyde-2,1-aminomutase [Firmicutes bacterium HGW-Firmicutes-16]